MKITQQAPVRKLNPLATGVAILVAAFLLLFGLLHIIPGDREQASPAIAAAPAATPPSAAPTVAAPVALPPKAARVVTPPKPLLHSRIAPRKKPRNPARSAWSELDAAQQEALAPLASSWNGMSRFEKGEWLAMSKDFPSMPLDEQARLYTRMVEWASLSTQQRIQARLNFADTEELPTAEKEAKWKAYQALSPEEKRKFEAKAPARIRGAAQDLRPAPHRKMRPMRSSAKPIPAQALAPSEKLNTDVVPKYPPNIMETERQIDSRTLLPLTQPAAPVSAPAASH